MLSLEWGNKKYYFVNLHNMKAAFESLTRPGAPDYIQAMVYAHVVVDVPTNTFDKCKVNLTTVMDHYFKDIEA